MDRNGADAEVEIAPETLLANHGRQVLVRGGDQPYVDLAILHDADAAEGLVLQHLQQRRLQSQFEVTDLVEKQRPPVGTLTHRGHRQFNRHVPLEELAIAVVRVVHEVAGDERIHTGRARCYRTRQALSISQPNGLGALDSREAYRETVDMSFQGPGISLADPSALFALNAVETISVLWVSVLAVRFVRIHDRTFLTIWVWGGAAFAVRQAALLYRTVATAGSSLLVGDVVSQIAALMMSVLLTAGAFEIRYQRRVSPPVLLALVVLPAVGLVALQYALHPQLPAWLPPARAGISAITYVVATGMSAWWLASAVPWPMTLGRGTLVAALACFAIEQSIYVWMGLANRWPPEVPLLFGILRLMDVLLITGVYLGMTAFLLEVTEADLHAGRKAALSAQQALDENARYYQALIEGSTDVVTVLDDRGRVQFESPSIRRVLGWEPADVGERRTLDGIHASDRQAVLATARRLMGGEGSVARATFRARHVDGGWRLVESEGRELLSPGGPRRFVVTSRDITDRARLEQRLLHVQKMESVGRLAGGVAHDFNNVLTAVMTNVAVARDVLGTNSEAAPELNDALEAARRGASLTRQLLAFSRQQDVELSSVDLNELTAGLLRMLQRLVGEDLELVTDFAPRLPQVQADPGQLEQVLTNLVVNARDAMPAGGILRIRTFGLDLEEPLTRGREIVPAGRYSCFAVQDSGPGVPEDVRDLLFEPFFTTKPRGQGTGLGLATCYGIVKRHDGFIWFETRVGEVHWTEFVVALPLVAAAVDAQAVALVDRAGHPEGSEVVLLVEDDDLVRKSTRRLLTAHGYQVVEAENGEQALGAMAGTPTPDLVVTDVVMPRMDGFEFVAHLRRHRPDLSVLFISGYHATPAERQPRADARTLYLHKPFTEGEVLHALRQLLDRTPVV